MHVHASLQQAYVLVAGRTPSTHSTQLVFGGATPALLLTCLHAPPRHCLVTCLPCMPGRHLPGCATGCSHNRGITILCNNPVAMRCKQRMFSAPLTTTGATCLAGDASAPVVQAAPPLVTTPDGLPLYTGTCAHGGDVSCGHTTLQRARRAGRPGGMPSTVHTVQGLLGQREQSGGQVRASASHAIWALRHGLQSPRRACAGGSQAVKGLAEALFLQNASSRYVHQGFQRSCIAVAFNPAGTLLASTQ